MDANYGTRDAEVQGTLAVGSLTASVKAKNKTTGMQDGATNGLSGSRWGIRGSEDLGGGMSANFVLESAITQTTGASTGFTRNALVGIKGGFGSIDLGRTYSPMFYTMLGSDATALAGSTTVSFGQGLTAQERIAAGAADTTTDALGPTFQSRRSNSINYTSPSFNGVTARVQIAKEKTSSATASTAKTDGLGVSLTYTSGPLMLSWAHDSQKGLASEFTGVAGAGGKTSGNAIGGSYDLGVAKVFANWSSGKAKDTQAGGRYTNKFGQTNIGVQVPMGKATIIAAFGRNTMKESEGTYNTNFKGNDHFVGVNYALSKRTTAYANFGTQGQLKGSVGAVTLSKKTDFTTVGLRHSF